MHSDALSKIYFQNFFQSAIFFLKYSGDDFKNSQTYFFKNSFRHLGNTPGKFSWIRLENSARTPSGILALLLLAILPGIPIEIHAEIHTTILSGVPVVFLHIFP